MSKKNNSKKKRTKIIVLTVALVLVALLICGVAIKLLAGKSENKKEEKEKEENAIESGEEIGIHTTDPNVDEEYISQDLSIDIPYGVIRFPSEFSDYTHIETEETEERYKIIFSCKYEENNIQLFDVTFGEPEEGADVVGQLIDTGDDSKKISVRVYELKQDTTWTQDNAELLYSMQEAVNYVMENFESSYEFRPVE